MKSAQFRSIDPSELRAGMYVHLVGGWISHPFPLSTFRIDSAQQIETIQQLGIAVRWAPELSAAAEDAAVADAPRVAPPVPVQSPEIRQRAERRRRAAAQREALRRCERQYEEAGRDLQRAWAAVPGQPEAARGIAEELSHALVAKMLGEREVCIRLLSDGVGNRASMHALNVMIVSLLMGRTLGLPENDLHDLGVGAMLHDVGKIDLPERVRQRSEPWGAAEQGQYEEHVARGVATARRMGLSAGASLVIAQHHEHADGSGFPLKLSAERLTPIARIVALVNHYDRLCNPAPGARVYTPHEAVSHMFAHGKERFDTALLGAFIKMMGVYPPGSTVQLTDDRYALVVGANATRPLKPRVLVHEAGMVSGDTLIVDLEGEPHLGIRRGTPTAALPAAALQFLAPRRRVTYGFDSASEPAPAML